MESSTSNPRGLSMRRIPILTTAAAVALVPAVFGLSGNPALSHSVPVRVPATSPP